MKKFFLMFIVVLAVLAGTGLWVWRSRGFPGLRSGRQEKMYVVGVVRAPPSLDVIYESFRAKMKNLGYEEGKNVIYKVTEVGGDAAETKKRVALLMDQHLDVIYPLGGLATHAAKDLTDERHSALPIVFGITADPVKAKLAASLKSSGNNVTGVVSANEIVSSKRLQLFLEADPKIKRVVFPWSDPVTTGIENFRETARTLGVELKEQQVANVDEFDRFLASFPFRRGDGLFRASDTIAATRTDVMAALALKKKIPFCGTNAFDVQKGALMSYGANFEKMGEQGAVLVDKVLRKGKAPSDLPIELPADFDLVVNLASAQALGITLSPEFLAQATRIIR